MYRWEGSWSAHVQEALLRGSHANGITKIYSDKDYSWKAKLMLEPKMAVCKSKIGDLSAY